MWKLYFKQIRYQLRENRFFSLVYIIGTALSITMVMLILLTYHIRVDNLGVEDKRDRTLYASWAFVFRADNESSNSSAMMGVDMVEKVFQPLQTPEAVTAIAASNATLEDARTTMRKEMPCIATDGDFWKVFSFRFLEGQPFNREDVESKALKAVVSESLARTLFGRTDVVGYPLKLNWQDYRICGVVEDVPFYLPFAYATVWVPYTSDQKANDKYGYNRKLGRMQACILLRHKSDRDKVKAEVDHNLHMYNAQDTKYRIKIGKQPDDILQTQLRALQSGSYKEPSTGGFIGGMVAILLVLLIVPALNISGLIVSRMQQRREEIAVRKVFGASTANLLWQLLCENFIQLLLGGFLGLWLSIALFQWLRMSMLSSVYNLFSTPADFAYVEFWHVISPVTVAYVLVACFLLNLFSALFPVWRSIRKPVVESFKK